MHFQSLTPQDATGLLSLIGLIILFVGLIFLVRRTNLKRQKQAEVKPSPAAKPFPQTSTILQQIPTISQEESTERQAALREAFQLWQTNYLLAGLDKDTAFLRGETQKRGLRYQITSTSLTQGLALFIQTQMAQDGDDSRATFERLLAQLLAHPAGGNPALSSWLSMPDLPTSPRLDPDPHAEAWILTALLAAKTQWGSLERFNLDQLFQERSLALAELLKQTAENQQPVFSPYLFSVIARNAPDLPWQAQAEADWQALIPLLRETDSMPGRQQALSLLQIGLEGQLSPAGDFAEKSDLAFSRLKRAFAELGQHDGDLEEGFSGLASLSCCVPLALLSKNQADSSQLWARVSQAQPVKQDSLGASLRLLAMMSMAGTLWLD